MYLEITIKKIDVEKLKDAYEKKIEAYSVLEDIRTSGKGPSESISRSKIYKIDELIKDNYDYESLDCFTAIEIVKDIMLKRINLTMGSKEDIDELTMIEPGDIIEIDSKFYVKYYVFITKQGYVVEFEDNEEMPF